MTAGEVTAVILLWGGLVATIAVAAVVHVWRSRYGPVQLLCFYAAQLLTRFLWGARMPHRLPIPLDQGAVVISNHRSSVDPFFIQMAVGRPAHWMVAREYCEHVAFRWFLVDICDVIPVRRGGIDTAATKLSIRLAQQGGVIGVFPEGRINKTDELMIPGRPGAVLLALKARVPIVPCYIEGSPYGGTVWSPFFMTARVRMVCGDPIDLSPYFGREREDGVLGELMLRCMRRIADLAGDPTFQPRLATRKWNADDQA